MILAKIYYSCYFKHVFPTMNSNGSEFQFPSSLEHYLSAGTGANGYSQIIDYLF